MTVLSEQSSRTFAGNGVTTDFNCGFRALEDAHLTVQQVVGGVLPAITLALGTHYTVANAGTEDDVVVTMLTAPANTDTLTVERNTPVLQSVALRLEGRFLSADIEEMFDKLTLVAQENRRIAEEAAALAEPAVVSAGSIVFTDKTFLTGDEVEDSFPMDVAVTSGSTATGCWAVRLENDDDAAEVFDEPPAIQWDPGVGNNVSLKYVSGLKPNTNYTLRIATVIP